MAGGVGMCPSVLLAGRMIFVYTYLYRWGWGGLIGMSLRTRATSEGMAIGGTGEDAGLPDRYLGYSRVAGGGVEGCGAGEVLSSGEEGGEPAAGCGCDCVAEEGWQGESEPGESDAAGE